MTAMIGRASLAVRVVIALAGLALLVAPGEFHPFPLVLTSLGVVAAVAWPRSIGASAATAGFVVSWLAASGWAATMPVGRTVVAAAALYVLHVSCALAATAPVAARIDRAALMRWARRSLWPLAAAAPLVALDQALPRGTGPAWPELAGLVAVLVLAGAGAYAVRRRTALNQQSAVNQ